jgi:hypothetical protein
MKLLALILSLLLSSVSGHKALAHGGGLDGQGCHHNIKQVDVIATVVV